MNAYEKLINQMRQQGKYYNDPSIQIGTVLSGKKINLADLTLDSDDYLLDCNLTFDEDAKYFHTGKSETSDLKAYKANILEEGDLIIGVKVVRDNTEQFVILSKVVEV